MPSSKSIIQFKYGLFANYKKIATKDVNTVYFTTDTQQLFVGDIEYSRPVSHGSELPSQFLPPNSLFVKDSDTLRTLYYSKDGASWDQIAALPTNVTGGVFGNNTQTALKFGSSFTVPKLTVNDNGFVTAGKDISISLPAESKVSVTTSGTGNAITGVSVDDTGYKLTVSKGGNFMPKSGGAFTGAITVTAPTSDSNPATKKYVDDAIGDITQFEFQVVSELPTTGTKGVIYLVAHAHGDNDIYDEYIWVTNKFEKIGNTDVDLSNYVTTTKLSTELNKKVSTTATINGVKLTGSEITIPVGASNLADLKDVSVASPANGQVIAYNSSSSKYVNKTITKSDVGLSNVDNTADSAKSVASAAKLKTPRTIQLSGAVTGTATSFDGSKNITISCTSVDGSKVSGTVGSAMNDGSGNAIAETYATKSELQAAALTWGTF